MDNKNKNNENNSKQNDINQNQINEETPNPDTRFFTLEELKKYNGKDGMPAYVAMDGVVYDVTDSVLWKNGDHFGMIAGKDLTIGYKTCHVGRPRIGKFPVVGYLIKSEPTN